VIEQPYLGLGAVKTQPAKVGKAQEIVVILVSKTLVARPASWPEAEKPGLSNRHTSLHSELPDKQMGML